MKNLQNRKTHQQQKIMKLFVSNNSSASIEKQQIDVELTETVNSYLKTSSFSEKIWVKT